MRNELFLSLRDAINTASEVTGLNLVDCGPLVAGLKANLWKSEVGPSGVGFIVLIEKRGEESFTLDAQISKDFTFHPEIPALMEPIGPTRDEYDSGVMSFRMPFLWGGDHWWKVIGRSGLGQKSEIKPPFGKVRSGSQEECIADVIGAINQYYLPYLRAEISGH